jgi:murein L,D-transpeptidase YcbB/YkuD
MNSLGWSCGSSRSLHPAPRRRSSDRAKSAMEEIARADDYGLRASEYELPKAEGFSPDDAVNWLADAEVKISIAVLRYAYDARGGRILPSRLTKNLSLTLTLPDALEVLDSMAVNADPALYLRSFQPSHPQFELLRQKLLRAWSAFASKSVFDAEKYGPPSTRHNCHSRRVLFAGNAASLFVCRRLS